MVAWRRQGRSSSNGFVLAHEAVEGRSLDRMSRRGDLWAQVVEMRAHRIAHRRRAGRSAHYA